jgi:hypothetical protein
MQVRIGDIIKSYDFPNMLNCYIIGKVVKVENNYITARIIKAVSENKEYDLESATFKTPVQGLGMFDDKFERVVVLG